MKSFALLATALGLMALPAQAQDAAYTPQDQTSLQQCIEAVNDTLASEPDSAITASQCIGVASNACQSEPGGASTVGITTCNQRETAWWDEYLNGAYDQLKQGLDPSVFASLKTAQRSWIAFRDADCSFQYERYGDGSMRNIAHSACMMSHTAQRAIDLYALSEEGN